MSVSEFDWTSVSLTGMQLIEASAGTGKTWTLTMLYLRLLLETALQPENILVVTFTKAATAELKERLRYRLAETLTILQSAPPTDNGFAHMLYQRYGNDTYLLRKLTAALRHFDRAAVYTIHGFCQRVLTDHAFNMGLSFAWTLNPDDTLLIKRLIDDFWYQHIAPATGLWPRFLYTQRITPASWLTEIQQLLGKISYSQTLMPTSAESDAAEAAYNIAYSNARDWWLRDAEHIKTRILTAKLGYRTTSFARIAEALSPPLPHFALGHMPDGESILQRFSTSVLAKIAQDKNKAVPEHPFFEAVTHLMHAYQQLQTAFKAKQAATLAMLLQYCEKELPTVKQHQQEVAYHDLLSQLDQALQKDQAGKLAQLLQKRFAAALIDEFQDTDPIQYRIFSRIYQDTLCPVFLIGDPKQAIYSFRGADIYTYLSAQTKTVATWTLPINYRSTPAVVASLNYLFSRQSAAFWLPQITYLHVTASPHSQSILHDPASNAALQCWRLENEPSTRLSKETAALQVIAAIGTEIQRLLQQATLDKQPVLAGDIAILVPSHHHAAQILSYLVTKGIPAVRQGMDNVLMSSDAWEWLRIFCAFLEPHREDLRKNALLTLYMGIDAHGLHALIQDETRWEMIAMQFTHYHALWQRHGLTRAFRTWLSEWGVAARLMNLPDGERRLTNLLHLIDILQQKSQTTPHLSTLVDWFNREIAQPSIEQEITQLRLESDAARVKIITIHAAKGLEFPIVFCPFLWHGNIKESTQGTVVFHDETGQSYLDFGSAEQHQHHVKAQEELFAEKLRVLYVALTRAKYRNYIAWGNINGVEGAALSWLLYGTENPSLRTFMQHVRQLDDEAWWHPWQHMPAGIQLTCCPLPDQAYSTPQGVKPSLTAATWTRAPLIQQRMVTSFSALTQGQHSELSAGALHQVDETTDETDRQSIAAFPAGARTGLCWHNIIERWDFQPGRQVERLITHYLQAYGFAPEWDKVVKRMLLQVGQVSFAGHPLSTIPAACRNSELAFTFRLAALTHNELFHILQQMGETAWAQACQSLRFETLHGMMTGFIDLVVEANGQFFIVDYKSNRLGAQASAYHPDALRLAMASHHYYLQYLIYSVAIHRYLRQRLPNYHYAKHFGGVVYIFMRGLVAGTESGIFRARPKQALIEALDKRLDRSTSC